MTIITNHSFVNNSVEQIQKDNRHIDIPISSLYMVYTLQRQKKTLMFYGGYHFVLNTNQMYLVMLF